MRQTREQRLTELLQQSTTNTSATSMVHATMGDATTGWEDWFGATVNARHDESGFAMIDNGKLYFYKVTGLGKRQTIEGRREIAFDRIERVRRVKGSWIAPAVLNIRWRNNNDTRKALTLGSPIGGMVGVARKQFPNQLPHINEMTQLILANNVKIKPDRAGRILLWGLLLLLFIGLLAGIAAFIIYFYFPELW